MTKEQLQVKALKALVARETIVAYDCDDVDAYITFDGYSVFAVPKQDMYIDMSKMHHAPLLRTLFFLDDGYVEAKLTKRRATLDTNGGIIREYRARDDASIKAWVQEIPLKLYQSKKFTAYIRNELSAVKFVDIVTGKVDHIILPVRVAEEIKND